MKKYIFSIIIALCILFSCKNTNENSEKTNAISSTDNEVIYTSANTLGYLEFEKEFNEYKIVGVKNAQNFSTNEMDFLLKENEFNFSKSDEFSYYTIKTFDIEQTNFKVIIYTTYGENGSKVVNVQLNSYQSGAQVDALLLDCRFEFETEYYRNFVIKKDKTVEIKKIAVDKLLYNEDGDIIGNREVNDTLVTIVKYKIDPSGKFLTN